MTKDKNSYTIFLMASALFLASFLVYSNTLFNDFVFEDTINILENRLIMDFRNLPELFSSDVWSHLGGADAETHKYYFKPLYKLVHMIDYYLFGFNAAGYHLTIILINSFVVLVLFFLIIELPITGVDRLTAAFFASCLFAMTPIHTEAVAWVSGISDPAFTFFYLLAFYLHIRSKHVYSAMAFLVSLLFKESAITLPLILILFDVSFGRLKTTGLSMMKSLADKYLYLMFSIAIYMALRTYAVGGIGYLNKTAWELSGWQYFINAFPVFSLYLEKLLLPIDLRFIRPFEPVYSLIGSGIWIHIMVAVCYAGISAYLWKKERMFFFLMLFIPVSMLPVFYLPAFGNYVFAERYLYLPSAAFCILSAILIIRLFGKKSLILFLIIISLYAAGTVRRNQVWKDDVIFWQDFLTKNPDNFIGHAELAYGYLDKGMMDKAILHYKKSIELNIYNVTAYKNLGKIYLSMGMYDSAIAILRNASLLNPDSADIYYDLGLCYRLKGMEREAQEFFDKSVGLKPILQ